MRRKVVIGVSILGGSILLLLALTRLSGPKKSTDPTEKEAEIQPVIRYEFEIPVDSFDQEIIRIRPNQYLADLLLPRGINYARIDQLARQSKSVFDVTRMKAGNRCRFFFTPDSLSQLKYLVYEIDQTNYVVYSFVDSLEIRRGQKEVMMKEGHISGTLNSNLWTDIRDLKVSPNLALDMMDIYAWTIDMSALRKGDEFEAIFDNQYVDSTYLGIGKVYATRMKHAGKERYAFLFGQNGKESYFDEDGQSLERSFLKAPLNFSRISSKYSNSRLHPILRIRRPHHGVDYAASLGTPVWSIGDGTVVSVSYSNGSGNFIKIKHNSVYTSGYMHLRYRPKYKVGDHVKQKEVIGNVGMTGLATGPHLDFRIWKNGQPVDPLKVESPPVEPVEKELRPVFDSIVQVYREKLAEKEEILNP